MNFTPEFIWVSDAHSAARLINKWHEDYPHRIPATEELINKYVKYVRNSYPDVLNIQLLDINKQVGFDGEWRKVDVRIGYDRPPHWREVPELMERLEKNFKLYPKDSEDKYEALKEWYRQLETIHPFRDGNGRTGGIMVAAISKFYSVNKYMAPLQ